MGLEPSVDLQTVDITVEARQEVHREPEINDGRGWPWRTSRFFPGRRLLRRRWCSASTSGAEPSWGCSHTLFLLRDCGRLPHLACAIHMIVVVYNSFHHRFLLLRF